jgi:KipI family sensor histidine kinase inhibitor
MPPSATPTHGALAPDPYGVSARLRWVTERGLRVEAGDAVVALHRALASGGFDEVRDLIPADGSLLVVLRPGAAPSPRLLRALARPVEDDSEAPGHSFEFRAHFGGRHGPDLADLARAAGMSEARAIELLTAAEFRVRFLGFQPGFAYLAGVPEPLRASRRATPRTRVRAGSVALGGGYCGIYPGDSPGGWHIVGRIVEYADTLLFDAAREPPALLAPGDRVRFVAES